MNGLRIFRIARQGNLAHRSGLRRARHACPQCRQFFTSGKDGQANKEGPGKGEGDGQERKQERWADMDIFSWPKLEWKMIPASVGFACIGVVAFRRSRERHERNQARAEEMATIYNGVEVESWKVRLAMILPSRTVSRLWGWLASLHMPVWMRGPVLGLYVRTFKCNMDEADSSADVRDYQSLNHLFNRTLKPGIRPISHDVPLVSPCDGTIAHVAKVDSRGCVEQVKGLRYPVAALYGPNIGPALPQAVANEDVAGSASKAPAPASSRHGGEERHLYQCIVYLSPGDYHHFHSPAEWAVEHRRHFAGELFPVAVPVFKRVAGLMAINERVVLTGTWRYGFFSLVAVGALNVGSMKIAFDEDLNTNLDENYIPGFYRDLRLSNVDLKNGSYVGQFLLGSTLAVVFEAPPDFDFTVKAGDKVRFGEPIGRRTALENGTAKG